MIGPDAGMFPDTPSRLKIDLSGQWQYSLDGKIWRQILIPSAYDATAKISFMRTFEITPEMLDRYVFFLVAYGINYQCEIHINKNFIGRHFGGYSSFIFPIGEDILLSGENNTIQVVVENELSPNSTLPLRHQIGGWRNYGGIYRDIYILAVPRLFIEQVNVITRVSDDNRFGTISANVEISDQNSKIKNGAGILLGLQLEVYGKISNELITRSSVVPFTYSSNKTTTVKVQAQVNEPKLWSPQLPDLYVAKFQIVKIVNREQEMIDEYKIDIGFRNIKWENGVLLLNNSQVILNGVTWNEDHPSFASALTYELMERDVAQIKSLGANLIRFRYPPHPYLLNLCDRYGLFVLEEVPAIKVPAEILIRDYFQDLEITYLREMVQRDKHHVSVLCWGIGDELETSAQQTCEFINSMRNIVKSMDDRPIYYATHFLNDRCLEYVDIIGINWYSNEPKKLIDDLKKLQEQYLQKPIIITRYGTLVEPQNRNGLSDPRSMESQAQTIVQIHKQIKASKIAGGVLWSFNDWRSDRPALISLAQDPYLFTMGIVSYDREKRVGFDVARQVFRGEKVQALPVGNYSSSTPIIYVITSLAIFLLFFGFYNRNRRFRECINRSLIRTYNFFADIRDQRLISYFHSIFLGFIIAVTGAIICSSFFLHYRDNIIFDHLLSHFLPDPVKEWLVQLIWYPPHFILYVSIIFYFKLFLLAALIKFLSMFVRSHVYFYHAFSVSLWSLVPLLFLIPLSMILFSLLKSTMYILPVCVFIFLIIIWSVVRLFKGIAIIYDVYPIKIYIGGFVIIIISIIALYGYFDYTQSTSIYIKYFLQSISPS